MPFDNYDYTYSLYPLQSGHSKLPLFHVKYNINEQLSAEERISLDSSLDSVVQRMITTDLFVMPFKAPEN